MRSQDASDRARISDLGKKGFLGERKKGTISGGLKMAGIARNAENVEVSAGANSSEASPARILAHSRLTRSGAIRNSILKSRPPPFSRRAIFHLLQFVKNYLLSVS